MKNLYLASRLAIAFTLFSIFTPFLSMAQEVNRIEPPFWWAGMKNTELQLMVYGKNIGNTEPKINYPGIQIKEVIRPENSNYLFINLEISPHILPGKFKINFETGKRKHPSVEYELKKRAESSALRQGFDNTDVIYLLMPDRFANGNMKNDNITGMLEKADRSNPDGRHGGDLEGIRKNLDYFNSLGVTALWLNPVLENNMPSYSYHGYAITDFYKIDPRFGDNQSYVNLIEEAHQKELKIIKDMVFNHFGTKHWWMNDLPMADWINQWSEFTRSNYRGGTLLDPHAATADKEQMLRGWFDKTMADLNQDNQFVVNYLTQNSIWWIEYANLDGFRVDTYPYSGKKFMQEWIQSIYKEYPNFSIVGEVWLNNTPQLAYWMEGAKNQDGFDSGLKFVFDFPLKYAITNAFNEANGWDSGISRLYESLSQDFMYKNPQHIINFADNHDADRIYTALNENLPQFKMAMAFLLTVRGIPQIYYGTEILMSGHEHEGHGFIRQDFPGGWDNDKTNVFTRTNLSYEQEEALSFVQSILQWRKDKNVIHHGKMTHYVPEDGIYVYFRHTKEESVMVILNNNKESRTFTTERFAENLKGYTTGTDILYRTFFDQLRMISIPAMSARIIDLKK